MPALIELLNKLHINGEIISEHIFAIYLITEDTSDLVEV